MIRSSRIAGKGFDFHMDASDLVFILNKLLGHKLVRPLLENRWRTSLRGELRIGEHTVLNGAKLLVRVPVKCSLFVGQFSHLSCSLIFEKDDARIHIGSRTHVGGGTIIDAATSIQIGDDVLVGFNVLIADHDSHSLKFEERKNDVRDWIRGMKDWTHVKRSPVRIEDKAWVGAHSIILKGVAVGEGAVVGAGSVVTNDVPPYTIVAGNPAKKIGEVPVEDR